MKQKCNNHMENMSIFEDAASELFQDNFAKEATKVCKVKT